MTSYFRIGNSILYYCIAYRKQKKPLLVFPTCFSYKRFIIEITKSCILNSLFSKRKRFYFWAFPNFSSQPNIENVLFFKIEPLLDPLDIQYPPGGDT